MRVSLYNGNENLLLATKGLEKVEYLLKDGILMKSRTTEGERFIEDLIDNLDLSMPFGELHRSIPSM